MRFFLDGETRARHAYIDASVENYRQQLEIPEMVERLGESNVQLLQRVTEEFTVANHRHGAIMMPKSLDGNFIPVAAARPGETVDIDPRANQQAPVQQNNSIEKFKGWFAGGEAFARESLAAFGPSGKPNRQAQRLVLGRQSVALVAALPRRVNLSQAPGAKNKIGNVDHRYLVGRPTMILSYDGDTRMDPSVLVHESRHLVQFLFEPVLRIADNRGWLDYSFRNELEAYASQARAQRALVASGYVPQPAEKLSFRIDEEGRVFSTVAKIDSLRKERNARRRDKYFPDGALRKELLKIGLDIVGTHSSEDEPQKA
jgi:hypothetical protein